MEKKVGFKLHKVKKNWVTIGVSTLSMVALAGGALLADQSAQADEVSLPNGDGFEQTDAGIELFEDDNWTRSKRFDIVNSAFSTTEKKRIKEELIISMYIDPKTGKVSEVDFIFHTFDSLATIPVSVYRKIETELKSNIWYTPTELGRKMNYILYWWDQKPK